MHNTIEDSLSQYSLNILASPPVPDNLSSQHPWGKSLLLIGIGGHSKAHQSKFWHLFCQSAEFSDQQPDPIDRWSQRIGHRLAEKFHGKALFPFTGPPYWPFLNWAESAKNSCPSRLGMHLHKEYGLWHSYRFALLLPEHHPEPVAGITPNTFRSPCIGCSQPCVSSCPVDAFQEHYDVEACRSYVIEGREAPEQQVVASNCARNGCLARQSCPAGQGRYPLQQQLYHMKIFALQKSK